MRFVKLRRLVALVLALTLTVGLAAHHSVAANMSVKMVPVASGDAPNTGMCDGCGSGGDVMPLAACSAYCTSPVMLLPDVAVVDVLLPVTVTHLAAAMVAGWGMPPDPYPPRTTILK